MKLITKLFLPVMLFSTLSLQSMAHDMDKKEMPAMTKEQREKMATMHEQVAKCLRSDKSAEDCHEEMKKSCMDMGEDNCPMMRHHKDMKKDMKKKSK